MRSMKFLGLAVLPALVISLFPAVPASAQETEELKIELPKPMFVGTPKTIRTPNLERVTGRKRRPFMAPKGTELLSLNKPVKASDPEPIIGEVEFVTDGDKEGADGSFVEFGPDKQWVQIDLEEECEIAAIVVWHYHSEARVYYDVIVEVSNDEDFIDSTKIFNNDHDNSYGLGFGKEKDYIESNEGKLIDAKGAKGRYVRLHSRGNTSNEMNHYVEVDVYGQKAG